MTEKCEYERVVSMRLKHGEPKRDVVFCGGNDYTCEWVKKNLGCPLEKQTGGDQHE